MSRAAVAFARAFMAAGRALQILCLAVLGAIVVSLWHDELDEIGGEE